MSRTVEVDRLALLQRSGSTRPRLVVGGRVLLAKSIGATLVDVGYPLDNPTGWESAVRPPTFDVEAEALTGDRFVIRGCRPTASCRMRGGEVASCRTVYAR